VENETMTTPQPLTGEEIRKGIAARIAASVPPEHFENIKEIIYDGLGKTCSLESSTCYSKFKADWKTGLNDDESEFLWWVNYELDDFGRISRGGIGYWNGTSITELISGKIDECPPDKFRRETDQPIPKSVELKKQEDQQGTFMRVARNSMPRRNV
jgi:hypothetical protein